MEREKGGIAFFDSGIGGLTVVKTCKKMLPNTLFYYYGDNKHAPYGNLPTKKIKKYVFKIFKRFERLNVWAAVVACNTATAVCIEELRLRFSFPIIGIEPAVLPAARQGGVVFVLATRATYESERFQRLCRDASMLFPFASIQAYACDALAGEIERHILEKNFDYTHLLPHGSPTVVVLGCTHYGFITEQIEKYYACPVVDGNVGVANRLLSVLQAKKGGDVHLQPLGNHFQPFEEKKQSKIEETDKKGRKENRQKNVLGGKAKEKKQEAAKRASQKEMAGIVFLGNSKKHNEKIYEHLFL